jgi:hypothetical protein
MKKVLVIDKCQDCKFEHCKYRQLVGSIPMKCPLMEYDALSEADWDCIRMIEEHDKHILGV